LIQISFARLILAKGEDFNGRIIRALLITNLDGIQKLIAESISFISFMLFSMLVITKGYTRVSEVAARLTLDFCPGKQMAIEAEYDSGTITEEEAIANKNTLQREVDFYGAMEGASKFIYGYEKVCISITTISIIGGILISTLLNGETIFNALMTYIPLSLCNSYLALFICLIESIIGGIVVTRAVSANETLFKS